MARHLVRDPQLRLGFLVIWILVMSIQMTQISAAEQGFDDLVAVVRKTNTKLADEMEKRLNQSQQEVERFKKGHVVFGRIQLEGDEDPRGIISQMIVLDDGYFVDAIGAVDKPIGFRRHKYEPIEVNPLGPGPIEDLGVIQMKRVPPDRLASASGQLHVEGSKRSPRLDQIKAEWNIACEQVNTPHNGTEGISPHSMKGNTVTVELASDGTFKTDGLSPCRYRLHLSAPDCVNQIVTVDFTEGQVNVVAPIRLELSREVDVEFAVSKDGDFSNTEFKKSTLKADARWRASNDVPNYGFDLLIVQKDGQLMFDYRYAPCHIKDLGVVSLTDDLEVDEKELQNHQPQNVPVKEGHVYVILQSHWQHWILVRTTFPVTER